MKNKIREGIKFSLYVIGVILSIIPACFVKIEEKFTSDEKIFQTFGDIYALLPGKLGAYCRSGYYSLVLDYCAWDANIYCFVSIAHRETRLGKGVGIASFTSIGRCVIGENTIIGSGSHLISGKAEHTVNTDGVDQSIPLKGSSINVGKRVWFGNGCNIMADVGDGAVVGAGSVVTKPVPEFCVVAGNPAKVIKKLRD